MRLRKTALMLAALSLIAPTARANDKQPFAVQYDKATNVTTVQAGFYIVSYRGERTTFMYFCPGPTINCNPKAVAFRFEDLSLYRPQYKYKEMHRVAFLADSVSIQPIGTEQWYGDTALDGRYEAVTVFLNRSDFLAIADAQFVELHVGTSEFKIPARELSKWQALALLLAEPDR